MPENIEPPLENEEPQESEAEVVQRLDNIHGDLRWISEQITTRNQAMERGLDQLEQGIELLRKAHEATMQHIDSTARTVQTVVEAVNTIAEKFREMEKGLPSQREDTQQYPFAPY
ncbi:MAG: hypothetical protein WCV62_02035 [Candidatus Peribacteraceae bacterium]|jgi:methyl-accepting chemotaxis protein